MSATEDTYEPELGYHLALFAEMAEQRIEEGERVSLLTMHFAKTGGGRRRVLRRMADAADRFYRQLTADVARCDPRRRDWLLLPTLHFWPDTARDGRLFLRGLLVVPAECQLEGSIENHIEARRGKYLARPMLSLSSRPAPPSPKRTVLNALKSIRRGQFSPDYFIFCVPRPPRRVKE